MTWFLVAAGVTLAAFTGSQPCEQARTQLEPIAPAALTCVLVQTI